VKPVSQHCILALDQGTTSSRALVFDANANVRATAQREFAQHFPKPGWVEHDAMDIWRSQVAVAREALDAAHANALTIAAIGITNQRETTILWDRRTGEPFGNAHAIVWQDRRTAATCDAIKRENPALEKRIREKTGLMVDPYFSATKLKWLLDNTPGARECAERDQLAFGTVDSWLLFKLTEGEGKVHATDVSNASRTMLFNLHTLDWDDELLAAFDIPRSVLPRIVSSSGVVGHTACPELPTGIPIAGIAGDQQAALFGQACVSPGMAKNTYGTGCFMLMNTGEAPLIPPAETGLLATVAWRIGDQTHYALEGSVFIAGAAVQWLRDGLGIIEKASDIEALAASVPSSDGVVFVPAFAGLGTPHWDSRARGIIVGLTRGSTRAHIARAALDAIAFQSAEVLHTMRDVGNLTLAALRVDGGATANNLLMQTQADVLGVTVQRPRVTESTALGAAYLAGLAVGVWGSISEIEDASNSATGAAFQPSISHTEASARLKKWRDAVSRSRHWVDDETVKN
jgi:glycerol kinase